MDLVVLGHKLNRNGTLRPTLHQCLRIAVSLWRWSGQPDRIVVTGGPAGAHPTEAMVMRDYLIAHAVPADRILEEGRSSTTLENALFTKELGVVDPTVLTSEYHVDCARYLFSKVYGRDVPVIGVPTPTGDVYVTAREATRFCVEPFAMAKAYWQTRHLHRQDQHLPKGI